MKDNTKNTFYYDYIIDGKIIMPKYLRLKQYKTNLYVFLLFNTKKQ